MDDVFKIVAVVMLVVVYVQFVRLANAVLREIKESER